MNDNDVKELADVLSVYKYKIEALMNLLVEKEILAKDEINNMLARVMDEAEEVPEADEYVIEELKKKVLLK